MAVFLNFTCMRTPYPDHRTWNVVRLRDEQAPLLVGRSHEVPIRLEANTISRRHAELRVHEGKVAIRDIGAINGIRRFPGDQRCQPFIWVEVPPHQPIFVTEYQLTVLEQPPVTSVDYHACTDVDFLLRFIPGPYVQARLDTFEQLLTLPALQCSWTQGQDASFLVEASGINERRRPLFGESTPFHFRTGMLLRAAEQAGLLSRDDSLHMVRDLLGDFLLDWSVPPAVHAWHDGLVRTMALEIDRERRYGELPILADALEDAGCDRPELLDHLRGRIPHYPGCWALDLLTALPGTISPIQ